MKHRVATWHTECPGGVWLCLRTPMHKWRIFPPRLAWQWTTVTALHMQRAKTYCFRPPVHIWWHVLSLHPRTLVPQMCCLGCVESSACSSEQILKTWEYKHAVGLQVSFGSQNLKLTCLEPWVRHLLSGNFYSVGQVSWANSAWPIRPESYHSMIHISLELHTFIQVISTWEQ